MHKGSCLCGGVQYETAADLRPVITCHCTQCRKTSGHIWALTQVPDDALRLVTEETLQWYRSSGTAKRGFCNHCGASLFWQKDGEGKISIAAGTLESPSGLSTAEHIFTADKGDYYQLTDGLPQS